MGKHRAHTLGTLSISTLMVFIIVTFVTFAIVLMAYKQNKDAITRHKTLAEDTSQEISTELDVYEITVGGNSTNNDQADAFYTRVRKKPASDDIPLTGVIINLQLQDTELQTYAYSAEVNCTQKNQGDNSSFYNAQHNSHFGALYLTTPNTDGIVSGDDIVELCFTSPRILQQDEPVGITIIPKKGEPFKLDTNIPQTLTLDRNTIYRRGIQV